MNFQHLRTKIKTNIDIQDKIKRTLNNNHLCDCNQKFWNNKSKNISKKCWSRSQKINIENDNLLPCSKLYESKKTIKKSFEIKIKHKKNTKNKINISREFRFFPSQATKGFYNKYFGV